MFDLIFSMITDERLCVQERRESVCVSVTCEEVVNESSSFFIVIALYVIALTFVAFNSISKNGMNRFKI